MPIPEVRLTISDSLQSLVPEYVAANRRIYEDEALDLADELQSQSPVGATGQLKSGWNVIPARRLIGRFQVTVENTSDAAFFRIVGRGPGRFPPAEPIDDWVRSKGVSDEGERRRRVFLIRRKIAQKGTERWREQKNILGLRRGQKIEDSPRIRATADRIAERVNELNLPTRRGR